MRCGILYQLQQFDEPIECMLFIANRKLCFEGSGLDTGGGDSTKQAGCY